MITDQKHSSDPNEQEVIRYTKKLAQIFRLNEQNAEVYTALSKSSSSETSSSETSSSESSSSDSDIDEILRDQKTLDCLRNSP
ncbi:hypothetical protein RhiirC2_803022 [Rhizophagus irregularis]|uniref:Uncharacterized protein n=1 Tax=Rhizophagus irregularis TaxID=588596 RepID=A0A2N1M0T7_9GLOM|nr:hypothetical protein RhiirC2_803022 [Rhizophagus irregularis]